MSAPPAPTGVEAGATTDVEAAAPTGATTGAETWATDTERTRAKAPATAHGSGAPRRLRLLVVFLLLAGAVAYLLVEGLGSSLDYFDTVGQAMAHRSAIGARTIRLEGVVVPGSISRTARGADFRLSGEGRTVAVQNTGSPPQLFQTSIPVVVVGHFSGRSDLFVSDQIMVKHSATYIAAHPTRVKGPGGTVVP